MRTFLQQACRRRVFLPAFVPADDAGVVGGEHGA
jgi:hypothetical protein